MAKNNSNEVKRKKDGKINLYSRCIDCGFKKLETVDEKELNDLLKVYKTKWKQAECKQQRVVNYI